MRQPRFGIRPRYVFLLVAAAALFAGADRANRWWPYYRGMAERHAALEYESLVAAEAEESILQRWEAFEGDLSEMPSGEAFRSKGEWLAARWELVRRHRAEAAEHARKRQEYLSRWW
jgi:hypothetical protein